MQSLRSNITSSSMRLGYRMMSDIPKAAFLSTTEVSSRVINVIKTLKYAPNNISDTANYSKDLDFDSGIMSDLMNKLSKEFCVAIDADTVKKMTSVDATTKYFASHPKAR